MDDLTHRQNEVLEFIRAIVDQTGVPPSYREIGSALSIRSTNAVSDHIQALVRKGFLEQVGGRGTPRSLSLTTKAGGRAAAETVGIPVLGRIAAGAPLLAAENFEGTFQIDSGLLPAGGKVFALVVKGDSMIDDGIHHGDYLLVRSGNEAKNGEIAVVMVDEEATVKRIFREEGRIRLQPGNAAMDPIYVDPQTCSVDVLGRAVGIYRRI